MRLFSTLRNSKGFTLVELAIVLVIIGILLGAVLKGQEMINNARIKRSFTQQQEISAAIYAYLDRYGRYPGDDNAAAARWPASGTVPAATNGNGNGQIAGNAATMYNCTAAAVEACNMWDHLRRAGLITGAAGTFINPSNPYGGQIGVAYFASGTANPTTVNWIGLSNIPTDVALILDTQNDDGLQQTGTIRGSGAYTGVGVVNLNFRL